MGKEVENLNEGFRIKGFTNKYLNFAIRNFPYYEIGLVLRDGYRLEVVGGDQKVLQSGDVYFFSPNIPYEINPIQFQAKNKPKNEELVLNSIFFKELIFGKGLLELPEMISINKLLSNSLNGIKWDVTTGKFIDLYFKRLSRARGANKFILLFAMLNKMAAQKNGEPIIQSNRSSINIHHSMKGITTYLANNFDRKLTLDDMARMTNLSRYTFCRHFKQLTNQSFLNYLTELRIRMACRLLHGNQYNISQICYRIGFSTLSHFNKQFKRIMKCTPTDYRTFYRNKQS